MTYIGINAQCLFEWILLNPQSSGRALQDPQHDQLVTACAACALPLFAKLSYDSAVRWRSYQPVDECILGQAVEDSIELLFDRVEKYHGEVLVQHALGYVTAAKSGLRYYELICLGFLQAQLPVNKMSTGIYCTNHQNITT